MKKNIAMLALLGFVAGIVCMLIDPFTGDGSRLYIALLILSIGAVYTGWKYDSVVLIIYLIGCFFGIAIPGLLMEGSLHAGWAMLAGFMIVMLLMVPFLAGSIALIIKSYRNKSRYVSKN